MNEQVFSSSAAGYVVIPKLTAGSYAMSIGFPKNEWPAQQVNIKVTDKDLGFVLKNFDGKGWGLFNLQTMEILKASNTQAVASTDSSSGNMFSDVLADVVNTPSIKNASTVAKVPEAAVAEKKEVINEAPAITEEQARAGEPIVPVQSNVTRINTLKDSAGTVITYLSDGPLARDTVRIMLPAEKMPDATPKMDKIMVEPAKSAPDKPAMAEVVPSPPSPDEPSVNKPGDPRFLEMELPNPNQSPTGTTAAKPATIAIETNKPKDAVKEEKQSAGLVMINSDCKKLAEEDDFYKIRKNMSAERGDDGMVNAARKMFRLKCYSAEQVKNLSLLFLTDEGKYKFFDAAYPFIYDSSNFPALQSELTDDYYIQRFKAMIRK